MERLITTSNHIEPDRVPVFVNIGTWSISYYGTTVEQCLKNPEWFVKEVESKIYRQINCDAFMGAGFIDNFEFGEIVGNNANFISSDGVSIQHKELRMMEDADYPALISDPWKFFITDFIPKRYPGISIEKMADAVRCFVKFSENTSWVQKYFKDEFSIVNLTAGAGPVASPLEWIFGFLRGFRNALIDIRRRPEVLLEAIEALYPLCEERLGITSPGAKLDPFPAARTMFHIPTYLSAAQLEKFFVPTYNRLLKKLEPTGRKLLVFLEGDWSAHYGWLNSVPKNMMLGIVDQDDIIQMKKKVGANITLIGGMPLSLLKYESKQHCIDYAKHIIDECAPGGGFIFGTDKVLLCPGDVNPENYIAVNNFAYDYGRYS